MTLPVLLPAPQQHALQFVALVLLVDFGACARYNPFCLVQCAFPAGYYCFHRASHECNLLWAAHHVHHTSEYYNLTTALRQSAFQSCFSWLTYLPLALLFPPSMLMNPPPPSCYEKI